MDVAAIRSWLLQQPRPVVVRLSTEDGAQHELDVGHQSWAKLAGSISALSPILLEAYDAGKKLLRATRTDEATPAIPTTTAVVASISRDPETVRFELFARLIADAYKHSSEIAFAKLVELYEVQVASMGAMNKEVENLLRLLRREWEEKLEAAEEAASGDPLTQMAQGFLTGAAQSATEHPTNGKG